IGESSLANGDIHGFVYADGLMTDVGTLGGNGSSAFVLNDAGLIAGQALMAGGDMHGFVYSAGTISDVGTFGGAFSTAYLINISIFINDSGRVVGLGSHDGLSDWFILDLRRGNHPPVAVAGPNQTVDCQSEVTLDGGQSSDPDGDALTFEWSAGGSVLGTNST